MDEPVPLLQVGSSHERQLLDAARDDELPDVEARARALTAAKAALRAGAVAGAGVALATKGWPWKLALGLVPTKVVVVGCVAAVFVTSSASFLVATRPPAAPLPSTPERHTGPSLAPPRPRAPTSAAEPALPPAAPAASVVDETRRATPAASVAPPRPTTGSSLLATETRMLQEARSALAAGAPRDALAGLDRYEGKFPRGELLEDAGLLRVQALLAAGDRPGAIESAATFERRFPASAYLPRIRTLVAKIP